FCELRHAEESSSSLGHRFAGRLCVHSGCGVARGGQPQHENKPAITPRPSVGFTPAVVDLGEQKWGSVIPFQIFFVNHATKAVKIADVESSCGCTVVDTAALKGTAVASGQTLPIDVSLHTGKESGSRQRRITLRSESGESWGVDVLVNVLGSWSISTDSVDFGEIVLDQGENSAVSTVIYSSHDDTLEDVN